MAGEVVGWIRLFSGFGVNGPFQPKPTAYSRSEGAAGSIRWTESMEVRKNHPLFYFLGIFYVLWILWAWLLIRYPHVLAAGEIRMAARLSLWVAPAILFVRFYESRSIFEYLRLKQGPLKGLACGLGASLLVLGPTALYRLYFGRAHFQCPRDWASWLNPILSAPLAEEVLFRGVVFQDLGRRMSPWKAVLLSALLFTLAHAPYWLMSGEKAGLALALALGGVLVQGILFAILFLFSGSLWAPLVYHCMNNLVSLSLIP